jgi:hypothetical protein
MMSLKHSHLTLLLKKRKKKKKKRETQKEREREGEEGEIEETIPIRAAHTVSLYLNPVPLIGSSTSTLTAIIHIGVRCSSVLLSLSLSLCE